MAKKFDPAGDALDRTDNVMAGKANPGYKRYAAKKVFVKKSKPAPKTKYGAAGSIWSKMKGDVL